MRQIDQMSSDEIDVLKLKGMLPSEFRNRIKQQLQPPELDEYQPAPDELRDAYINDYDPLPNQEEE